MTALQLTFPDPWALLPVRDRSAMAGLMADLEELGSGSREAFDSYLAAVLPLLADVGVDAFASLALPDEESDALIQAFCAIGVVPAVGDIDAELRVIAEGGLHPGLDRETTSIDLPVGPGVRSSAIRFAEELRDDDGFAPYAAEVRFAFRLGGGRIGVLHFETLSLVYLDELEHLFDAIAATADIA